MNRKNCLAISLYSLCLVSTMSVSQNLTLYCPETHHLHFTPKVFDKQHQPSWGMVNAEGSPPANHTSFHNPYQRSAHRYPAYVPAGMTQADDTLLGAHISEKHQTFFTGNNNGGVLYCYYQYPERNKPEQLADLILASTKHAFHQCDDGRVIVEN